MTHVEQTTKVKLNKLLKRARKHVSTQDEATAQRIGFVYGNAPEGDKSTKETVRDALSGLYAKRSKKRAS